jgi:hypothetical protein
MLTEKIITKLIKKLANGESIIPRYTKITIDRKPLISFYIKVVFGFVICKMKKTIIKVPIV